MCLHEIDRVLHRLRSAGRRFPARDAWRNGNRDMYNTRIDADLENLVQLFRPKHVLRSTRKVARTVADADRAHGLAFSSCQLQDELALVLGLRFEDCERCALVAEAPVYEGGPRRRRRNRDRLEEAVQSFERYGRESGILLVVRHGWIRVGKLSRRSMAEEACRVL